MPTQTIEQRPARRTDDRPASRADVRTPSSPADARPAHRTDARAASRTDARTDARAACGTERPDTRAASRTEAAATAGTGERPARRSALTLAPADAELSWQESALCAQTGPELFFPEPGSSTREAKFLCGLCDIREACLEYALTHDERFGVWGGLSEQERHELRRRRAGRR